ncbi:hypothetical protein G9A89_022182 [Geosiphon pyriformis]|nr:hypothetical protein G9A89_022182 [Geosiphon pyriformis]
MPVHWYNQYAPLDYVSDNAFSNIMGVIGSDEFFLVVNELSDGKAVGISGIPNELWKLGNVQVLDSLLDIFDGCLELGVISLQTLINTRPIALVKMARKILFKIFFNRISLTYSNCNVFYDNNFLVLKGTSTQTLIFTIGFIIEDAFEKNRKLWLVLQDILAKIKMCLCFIEFFGSIHNGWTNRVMMDFGFTDGYTVHNRLDQGKVGNCLAVTQCILDIASEFFLINNIAINTDKMVVISINQGARSALLSISDSEISIAKKDEPSLVKAYSNIRFFSNVVLRKTITKKQFLYLVSAVLQPIVSYRLQFSCVSKSFKVNLSKNFLNKALYHLELYGLKTFEQVLAENLLAGLVKFANADRILSKLFKYRVMDKNNFKVATTPDATTLEYYQSIYTHCKQRFNIPDGIEVVKKSVYQYIENHINNYLFGNYNISEVRSNLYNNLAHYSQLKTEDLNSETLATYFHKLNFNIIKYCEETYPVHNKGKNKLKQYSRTTPNTPTLPKTTAKHLQTPEQRTKPLQTSSNLLDFLAENQSKHSETAANEENNSEITKEESIDSENEEDKMTTYIAKIPEFNGKDIETSPQEWLDQVTKAGDANEWNAARILRTISYFLKETAGEWFENLAIPFNDWNTFKAVFLEQFTDNNTSITLRNRFQNIKQKPSKSVRPHVPEDLNSAIQHAKRYKMAMEEANHIKLVNLAIGETSSAAEEKIDQLTKKPAPQPIQQQYQQPLIQHYQVPA